MFGHMSHASSHRMKPITFSHDTAAKSPPLPPFNVLIIIINITKSSFRITLLLFWCLRICRNKCVILKDAQNEYNLYPDYSNNEKEKGTRPAQHAAWRHLCNLWFIRAHSTINFPVPYTGNRTWFSLRKVYNSRGFANLWLIVRVVELRLTALAARQLQMKRPITLACAANAG